MQPNLKPNSTTSRAVMVLVAGILTYAAVAATTSPTLSIVSGNNQTGAAGYPLLFPLVVKFTQATGSPYPGVIVNFAISNDAVPSAQNAVTDANGNATITLTMGRALGAFTVTATATGAAAPVAFGLTTIAPPVQMTTTGDLQSGLMKSALTNQICVTVTGATGAVAGATVEFTVASGSATLNPATAATTASGSACSSVLLGASGPVVVNATTSGLPPAIFNLYSLGMAQIVSVVGAGNSVPAVTTVSPNGFVSLYGNNFAAPGTVATGTLVQGALPTTLAGICVQFDNKVAPLSLVTPTQINALVPGVPAGQMILVQAIQNCGASKPQPGAGAFASTRVASPEFLYWSADPAGKSAVVAVNSVTGSLVGPAGLLPNVALAPAKAGDYLTIYAIGFGATDPAFIIGQGPPIAAPAVLSPSVILGTAIPQSNILYAGVSPGTPGLYQLNIQVPDGLADGNYPIILNLGGYSTPPGPYLAVGH